MVTKGEILHNIKKRKDISKEKFIKWAADRGLDLKSALSWDEIISEAIPSISISEKDLESFIAKCELIKEFEVFTTGNSGIESIVSEKTDKKIIDRLLKLKEEREPLNYVQLNQLLVLSKESAVSDGFFNYYWCSSFNKHPYDVTKLPFYASYYNGSNSIKSIEHLKWG
jgi:hypothetical protein